MKNQNRLIDKIDRVGYLISKVSSMIGSTLIVLLVIMITLYTLNRAFVGQVWLFVEEWTALALVPICYLGIGFTLRKNQHLFVDILVERINIKKRVITEFIVSLISMIILGFMLERSLEWFVYNLESSIRSSGPMRTPLWIISITIVIGLSIYILDMIFYLIHLVLIGNDKQGLRFDFSATKEGE